MLGRRPHAVRMGAAAWWSAFYVTIAISFGVIFSLINGWELGAQFFTGYVVEYSLSVDNLFVFVIIIGSFAVPAAQQPKTLSVGIAVALILRAAFIAVGAALLDLFSFMCLIFGAALLATAVQLYRHRDQDPLLGDNAIVNLARRVLPFTTSYDESRIITYRRGRRLITPLFLALLAIGTTDVLFAFDSIPAVFGVTDHAYIVFAANAFALLGLRPLFFLGRQSRQPDPQSGCARERDHLRSARTRLRVRSVSACRQAAVSALRRFLGHRRFCCMSGATRVALRDFKPQLKDPMFIPPLSGPGIFDLGPPRTTASLHFRKLVALSLRTANEGDRAASASISHSRPCRLSVQLRRSGPLLPMTSRRVTARSARQTRSQSQRPHRSASARQATRGMVPSRRR